MSRGEGLRKAAQRIWTTEDINPVLLVMVRSTKMFVAIEGRDRVLMLAGQGFIAVVPLLIVLASLTSAAGAGGIGEAIVRRLALSDSAADAVRTLFAYPPGAAGGVTAFSLILLLFTVNGFAGSVQRTFESAWGLRRMGLRGAIDRTGGFVILLAAALTAGWGGRLLGDSVLGLVLGITLQLGLITGAWLVATRLLLSRRRPHRQLLVGAICSAAVQIAAGWGTAIYLPVIFERNAERYGVVGVALALVAWLIVASSTIVGGAVLSAVIGTDRAATPP